MKNTFITSITALGVFAMASSASAATLIAGGDIGLASDWSGNALPSAGDPGVVTVDGISDLSTFGYGAGIVTQTAGTIDTTTSGYTGWNMISGTWNLEGGAIDARFVLANNSTINVSGGTITTASTIGTNETGVITVAGSGVLSSTAVAIGAGGTLGFESAWTGTWTATTYSGTDWKDLLTGNSAFELDGAAIDAATFDSKFVVTNGGQTLSAVPEPSSAALLGLGGLALILRRRKG